MHGRPARVPSVAATRRRRHHRGRMLMSVDRAGRRTLTQAGGGGRRRGDGSQVLVMRLLRGVMRMDLMRMAVLVPRVTGVTQGDGIAVGIQRVASLADIRRGHPLFLLPAVAEPHPDDLLLQLKSFRRSHNFLGRRFRVLLEVGLQ